MNKVRLVVIVMLCVVLFGSKASGRNRGSEFSELKGLNSMSVDITLDDMGLSASQVYPSVVSKLRKAGIKVLDVDNADTSLEITAYKIMGKKKMCSLAIYVRLKTPVKIVRNNAMLKGEVWQGRFVGTYECGDVSDEADYDIGMIVDGFVDDYKLVNKVVKKKKVK